METDEQFVERFREQWKATGNLVGADKHRLLALALRGAKVQWRPIEEASRDEKLLICRGGGLIGDEVCQYNVEIGAWVCQNYTLEDSDFESLGYTRPTHFIPLSALGEPEK